MDKPKNEESETVWLDAGGNDYFSDIRVQIIGDWRKTLEKRPTEIDSGQNDPESPFYADNCINTISNSPSVRFSGCVMPDGLYKPNLGAEPMKYQYGVEYECKGVKPDLPDDVLVDAYGLYSQEWHNKEKPVSDWPWDNFEKFRIVDERYKPKPNLDELSAKEPTPELRGLMRGDWHERGELPPVGEVVIAIDKRVKNSSGDKCEVRYIGDDVCVLYDIYDDCEIAINPCHVEFRPIRTEHDKVVAAAEAAIETETGEPANSRHIGVLVKLGWRPPKN